MKIELKKITVKDVTSGYVDTDEEGVSGLDGKLNIRPKYQREFVYSQDKQEAVVKTVLAGLPLNAMYWAANADGCFEIVDGQQRTMSLCRYVHGKFSLNYRFFANLSDEERRQISDYQLMVYACEGTDKERLEWFTTINIAGEKLGDQELRNAVYAGPWLTDAKRRFSKTGCPAAKLAGDYVKGSPIRQDYLETALRWMSGGSIEQYMAVSQHKSNANTLWLYFQQVINWVKATFPTYRREMKGIQWGPLFDVHKDDVLDPASLETRIAELMQNEDVTRKSGVYAYVLTGDERHLSIRSFSDRQKREAFERQEGVCPDCLKTFTMENMEADHVLPWHAGGRTVGENCQMRCRACNRMKAGK